jgi:hypothetical protein
VPSPNVPGVSNCSALMPVTLWVACSRSVSAANVFAMPRVAVLRGFVMNHMIHHRAQLGVYLRMNDVPVPSIYGPSADEGTM